MKVSRSSPTERVVPASPGGRCAECCAMLPWCHGRGAERLPLLKRELRGESVSRKSRGGCLRPQQSTLAGRRRTTSTPPRSRHGESQYRLRVTFLIQEPVARGALGELGAIRGGTLDGFRDTPMRTVIIDGLGPRISSQIPRHPSVRQQVQAIVQMCLRVPGGLATLADVLTAFHGDDRTVERFRQLVEALSLPPELRVDERRDARLARIDFPDQYRVSRARAGCRCLVAVRCPLSAVRCPLPAGCPSSCRSPAVPPSPRRYQTIHRGITAKDHSQAVPVLVTTLEQLQEHRVGAAVWRLVAVPQPCRRHRAAVRRSGRRAVEPPGR
ncbi:hypothetical protein ACF053_27155 [Streptomyces kanasensis]|uniref:effector-associated domain 2-containing protein n=1 Tax=Streptomyces kanasensis TaxID=936756 RepID=UPI0036FD8694